MMERLLPPPIGFTCTPKVVGLAVSILFVMITGLALIPNVAVKQTGNGILERYVKTTFPQGWGFFTKSGREPIIVPYLQTDRGTAELTTSPVGQARYALGMSRTGRAQGIELGLLLKFLEGHWEECSNRDSRKCLEEASEKPFSVNATNHSPLPSVCGDVIFLETEPVPFEFRELGTNMT